MLTTNNAKALSKSLSKVYNDLLNNKIDVKVAKEIANVAGKIIKVNTGRLEYKKITDNHEPIDFWEE